MKVVFKELNKICSESQETIESKPTERQNQNNERDDTSEEIPERKPINFVIKIEDFEEENNSFISDLLIEKKANINNNFNINLETNVSDIEFNSRTGHQLNQTLNQNVVKTETQRDDNSGLVSNESIDITENDSHLEQAIDGQNEEFRNLSETLRKNVNRVITQTTEDTIVCDICSLTLKSQISLRRHKNKHTDRYLCSVGGCEFRGSHLFDLNRHMEGVHGIIHTISDKPKENLFKCEVCFRLFKTRRTLLQHKNTHTNKNLCGCDGCQFRGVSPFALRKHRTIAHSKTKPFNNFKDSNKRIKIENNSNECLISHKIQISDKTQENNELNDISVQPNDQILENANHLQTGRRSPLQVFKCDVKGCEKICQTSMGLRYHMNRHSDKYLCGINGCQKRAGSQSHLDRHKQIVHSDERPHKCVVNGCDKRFKTRCYLRTHEIRAHNILGQTSDKPEIKPFDCFLKYCKKKFISRIYLRRHMKGTHKLTTNLVNIYFKKYDKSRVLKEIQNFDNISNKTTISSNNQRTNDSNKEIEVIELDDEYEEKPLIESQLKVNKTIEKIS